MQTITIGRNPGNTIVINDPTVSRSHCQITPNGDGTYSITDLGSSNGTFVNGNRVSGTMPLRPGDMVVAGNASVQWQNYVGGGMPMGNWGGGGPIGYQPPMAPVGGGKSNNTGLIIGICSGVFVVVIVLILALAGVFKPKEPTEPIRQTNTNGVVTNVPGQQPANPTQSANQNPATTAQNPSNQVTVVEQPKEPDVSFAGAWVWESPSKTNFGGEICPCMMFNLTLRQTGDKIKGSYDCVDAAAGGIMDYDDQPGGNPVSGTVKGNQVTVKLVSTARGGSATGTLTYKNANTIEWKVTSVKGDYLGIIVPEKATLHRRKK